ncbi:MAG TPA: hypothetical protein VN914_20280 [Polyangia bacterium]|nr:hypothetical protein [Polyangia bacterium]
MDVTIGYGGPAKRDVVRPVFVVRGSEAAAAVGDEGWSEVEHAFFVGGAMLDHNTAVTPRMPPRPPLWLWPAVWAAALGCLALLFAMIF